VIFIKQGDSYDISVTLTINGATVTADDVETVEFMFGNVRKTFPKEAKFDSDTGEFLVPLLQKDTFSLEENNASPLDVRVKLKGGAVVGTRLMVYIPVFDALSEEVI
jgi:hypothetical protein